MEKEPERKEENKAHATSETAEELDSVFDEKERELEEKVEAALFIAGKFMSVQELLMLTDINPIMLKEILNRLVRKHSLGAVCIIQKGESWKMDVAPKYHYLINRLATGNVEFTKAEQETLAIIAYKQPIKQSVIIKIRGNKAYDHVHKFLELGLINSKRMGHTKELTLSEDFHEYFHLDKKQKPAEESPIEQSEQPEETTSPQPEQKSEKETPKEEEQK